MKVDFLFAGLAERNCSGKKAK